MSAICGVYRIVLLRAIRSLLKHLLRGLALVTLGVAGVVGFGAALATVPSPVPWDSAYQRHPTFYNLIAGVLTFLLVFWPLLAISFLILYRRKTRNQSISKEAENWLILRRTQPAALRRYTKIEGRLMWSSTILVLLISLFLPEIGGVISRLIHGRSVAVGSYHVAVPLTWTIVDENPSYVWVLNAEGVGRGGFGSYCRRDELQSATFNAIPPQRRADADWYFKYLKIVSTRNLRLRDQVLTCYEVLWYRYPTQQLLNLPPGQVDVECGTNVDDFAASFYGKRADLPTFYRVLETMQGR